MSTERSRPAGCPEVDVLDDRPCELAALPACRRRVMRASRGPVHSRSTSRPRRSSKLERGRRRAAASCSRRARAMPSSFRALELLEGLVR